MNVHDSFFIYLRWWDYKINVSLVEYINGSPVFYHLCVKIKTKHWNLVKNIINYQTHKDTMSTRPTTAAVFKTHRHVSQVAAPCQILPVKNGPSSGRLGPNLVIIAFVFILPHMMLPFWSPCWPFNLDHRWHVDCIVAFVCVRACCVCDSSLWFVVLVPWKCILNCIATLLHPQTGRSQITTQLLSGSGLAVRV